MRKILSLPQADKFVCISNTSRRLMFKYTKQPLMRDFNSSRQSMLGYVLSDLGNLIDVSNRLGSRNVCCAWG